MKGKGERKGVHRQGKKYLRHITIDKNVIHQ